MRLLHRTSQWTSFCRAAPRFQLRGSDGNEDAEKCFVRVTSLDYKPIFEDALADGLSMPSRAIESAGCNPHWYA